MSKCKCLQQQIMNLFTHAMREQNLEAAKFALAEISKSVWIIQPFDVTNYNSQSDQIFTIT